MTAGNEKSKAFFWDLERLEQSGTGEEAVQNENTKGLASGLPRHVREGSSASIASSAVSAGSSTAMKAKQQKLMKEAERSRGISDPFRSIKAHKIVEIPKYKTFALRHFAWSRDGQWCVGVGDCGLVNLFHRWEKGIPPLSTDSEVDLPVQEPDHNFSQLTALS